MRKTKIICTLGPSTDNEDVLRALIENGLNVARINMSHGTHEDARRRANSVKKLREEMGKPIALLLDTKGPEVRTGDFKNKKVSLKKGQRFTLTTEDILGDEERCSITYKDLPKDVREGTRILIDDGLIAMNVISVTSTDIVCEVLNNGDVSNHKGINVPGCKLSMPYLSEKDRDDIAFAVAEDFDFIAASFVTNHNDVVQIRRELAKCEGENIRIIAKIENAEGVDNIDEIIRYADGIMVARGDMGVEINMEEIPIIQKELISKAYKAGKVVVTATQMLESMVKNPRPTRAEATDVANAIYDGTSAIMLSGETAAGLYPVEAVKTMARIAERTEQDIDYITRFEQGEVILQKDVTTAISHATCTTAHDLGAVAILAVTKSGQTARMISKFRPACPIICGSPDKKAIRQMNLSWGVSPILIDEMTSTDELFAHVVEKAEEHGYVKSGDLTVITAGIPLGVSGTTNMLKVHLVGNILVEGTPVNDGSVYGKLCVCKDNEEARRKFVDGDILVIPKTDNSLMDIMRKAKGIITEEDGLSSHAAVVALALDKPVIVGAINATKLLTQGTTVRLEAAKGIVLSISNK